MPSRDQCKRLFGATLPAFCTMAKGQTARVMGAGSYFFPNVYAGACVQAWARVREQNKRIWRALAWVVFFTIHTLHIQRKAFIHGAKAGKGWSCNCFPLFTQGGGR